VSAVEQLIGELSEVCAGLPDQRTGPSRAVDDTMADFGLAAFSMFFMASPSFLAHQRALTEGHGRSNCETLFGLSAIPSGGTLAASLLAEMPEPEVLRRSGELSLMPGSVQATTDPARPSTGQRDFQDRQCCSAFVALHASAVGTEVTGVAVAA
jgi:hypothetical protein